MVSVSRHGMKIDESSDFYGPRHYPRYLSQVQNHHTLSSDIFAFNSVLRTRLSLSLCRIFFSERVGRLLVARSPSLPSPSSPPSIGARTVRSVSLAGAQDLTLGQTVRMYRSDRLDASTLYAAIVDKFGHKVRSARGVSGGQESALAVLAGDES